MVQLRAIAGYRVSAGMLDKSGKVRDRTIKGQNSKQLLLIVIC